MNKILIFLFGAFFYCFMQSSPVSVSDGGIGSTAISTNLLLLGGTDTTSYQFLPAGFGNSGQALVSAGSTTPVWQNVFPGYTAGTNFCHAGTTSTLAGSISPSRTVLITTTLPASITNSATDNIALGYNALNSVTSNTACVALGSGALQNATGNNNTAIGYFAANGTTSGTDNVAVGVNALKTNTTGSFNVAVGNGACQNSNVDGLVAIGHQALQANTTGTGNIGLGYQAGLLIQDGSRNTAVGYQAMQTNVSGNDNTAVGYQALNLCTGSQNTALGSGAGSTLTTGSNNIYIGYNAAPISNTESNTIVIGNSSHAKTHFSGIYSQTSSGGTNVLINSSSKLGTTTSSILFKKNIEAIDSTALSALLKVNVVQFNYNGDETEELYYGMIAEDVEKLLPETVVYFKNGDLFTIQYDKFIPLVIEQAQQDSLDPLKKEIMEIEQELAMICS